MCNPPKRIEALVGLGCTLVSAKTVGFGHIVFIIGREEGHRIFWNSRNTDNWRSSFGADTIVVFFIDVTFGFFGIFDDSYLSFLVR